MHLERYKKRRRNWRKIGARLFVVPMVIVGYAAYFALTPTDLTVTSIGPSSTNHAVLVLTIRNPTFKFLTGQLLLIDTTAQVPVPGNSSRFRILDSLGRTYSMTLSPLSSQTFSVPMTATVIPNIEYDVHVHIDLIGDEIIPVTLLSNPTG